MSRTLYRLGRFAGRRPWAVIAAWLAASLLVVVVSGAVGRDLRDSFDVPGLDSQDAVELLSRTNSDKAGLTAQVLVAPADEATTFFDSAEARAPRSPTRRIASPRCPTCSAPATRRARSPLGATPRRRVASCRPMGASRSSGCSTP